MVTEDNPDFSVSLTLGSGVRLRIRDIIPKDFYHLQIWRESLNEDSSNELALNVLELVLLSPKTKKRSFLLSLDVTDWMDLCGWLGEELLKDKNFTVEDWMETSFYLMKERWDSSMEWLETQPVSKIMYMIEIQTKHGKRVEQAMKRKK